MDRRSTLQRPAPSTGLRRRRRNTVALSFEIGTGASIARVIWQGEDGSRAVASNAGAARYFVLRHPLPARRFLGRIQKRAARIASVAASRILESIAPKKDTGTSEPWWVDAAAGAIGINAVDWLLLTGPAVNDKSVGFVFTHSAPYPTAVAKIAASGDAQGRVERGYRALEQLHDRGVTSRGLVPEPLALLSGPNGEIASVESAIRGTWLDGVIRPSSETRYVERLTDWLIELALATRAPERNNPWALFFRDVVDRFRETAAGFVDQGFLRDACASVEAISRLPTVFEHHDCAPWNFYVTPHQKLVAFDWDNANSSGIPAFDLVQALGYLALSVDGSLGTQHSATAFRRGESGRLGAVRRECRARYAAAVGIDDSTLKAIRVFAWMRRSNDEFEHRRRTASHPPRAEIARPMLGLWEAEARSALDTPTTF